MNTLCRPSPDLSCFRCCPPIRPAGYDHLDYRAEITRRLIENTDDYEAGRLGGPITGFWCWGLGLVDPRRKVAGCLLHPARNSEDLRVLTGYRDKCRRETCPQNDIFQALGEPVQKHLLGLVSGLDSFGFSSPRANPLWNLLLWGERVLIPVHTSLDRDTALYNYLAAHPEPRSRALILEGLLFRLGPDHAAQVISVQDFGGRFEQAMEPMIAGLRSCCGESSEEGIYVHRLGLDLALAQFIRFGLGLPKTTPARAEKLAGAVETALDRLTREFIPG